MLLKIILVLLAIIIYFVMESVAAEVYDRKGYKKLYGALMGLIPIYGLVSAFLAKPIRGVQTGTLRRIYKPTELLMKFITYTELVVLATLVVIPVFYIIGSSLSPTTGLPTTLWPANPTFENYRKLFEDTNFFTWYKNTLVVAILNTVIGVVFITGAGYVFARFKFKGKKFGLITILVLQVFPSFMGMVAMFVLFQTFGLLGKPTALTILYVGGSIPFNLWLIKGYLSQIPKDLDESAMLDGANKLQIFFKIILPLSVPILSFVAVNQFMAPWMDYMLPSFLLNILDSSTSTVGVTDTNDLINKQWTLAVGLFDMISGADKSSYTTFAAGALIVALPITVLYMCFQKFLIEGITAGATKG